MPRARRRVGRPKDPLALSVLLSIRVLPETRRKLEKRARLAKRRLCVFVRECLEDVVA